MKEASLLIQQWKFDVMRIQLCGVDWFCYTSLNHTMLDSQYTLLSLKVQCITHKS